MRIVRMGFLLLSVMFCAMTGFAESNHWRADLPFSFKVNHRTYPPGIYDITVDVNRGFVCLSSYLHPEHQVTWLGIPSDRVETAVMKFNVDGDTYTLKSVAAGKMTTPKLQRASKRALEASVVFPQR